MWFIVLIRIVIWLTFFLLIAEGIIAIIVIHWFYALYTRKHIELETRVLTIERRLDLAGKQEA